MKPDTASDVTRFFRLLRLHGVSVFSVLVPKANEVRALVAWPSDCDAGIVRDREDYQEVSWLPERDELVDRALSLGEHLLSTGHISIDKVSLNDMEMQRCASELGWTPEQVNEALARLYALEVRRIDGEETTDALFFHP